MPIKHEEFKMVDVIEADINNTTVSPCEIVETELDYDFYTDEIIEVKKVIQPDRLIPQEDLKYAIINIIAYVCSDLIVDYLNEYSKLAGSYVEGVKCRMVINSESPYCGNAVGKTL